MQRRSLQSSALTIIIIIVIVFSYVNLGIDPQVNCTVTFTGGNAAMMCKIPSHMDVVQVTWQKKSGNSPTLVTHSKRFGVKISKPYENRLLVLQTDDPGTSSIALSQLEKEGDACFTVIFNIYPNGALKGEVCLPKPRGVSEVMCKSPADFSVTLDPPQIKTQHSEPNGTIIRIGRWLNGPISPVCNFQLRDNARTNRSAPDRDKIFTIECNASGPQKATITWTNEGQPISREEKENSTGDFITVTSTRHHSLSTLSEHKGTSCTITYNKVDEINSMKVEDNGTNNVEHGVFQHGSNQEASLIRISMISIIPIVVLVVSIVMCYVSKRKNPKSPEKYIKAEKGDSTPISRNKHHSPNSVGTPGTEIKQRNRSSVKKNKGNIQQNIQDCSYSIPNTDEVANGTPTSKTNERNSSSQKKKKKSAKRLFT